MSPCKRHSYAPGAGNCKRCGTPRRARRPRGRAPSQDVLGTALSIVVGLACLPVLLLMAILGGKKK